MHLKEEGSEHGEAAAELVDEYKVRAARASIKGQDTESKSSQLGAQQRRRLVAIEAARGKLREKTDRIDGGAHREFGEELDLEEQQVRRTLDES